jgi:hypothetical protein
MVAQGRGKAFGQLSGPEKRWVLSHICVAGKAQRVSARVVTLTDSLKSITTMDGDLSGGKADALRHSLWMALLCQEMHWRKAKRLGNAHEKGNYLLSHKGESEDAVIPDKAAGEMDLWNNEKGLLIGKENRRSHEERLIELLIWMIEDGQMRVIAKDQFGRSLDAKGKMIPDDEWMGHWETRRVLVPSNSVRH